MENLFLLISTLISGWIDWTHELRGFRTVTAGIIAIVAIMYLTIVTHSDVAISINAMVNIIGILGGKTIVQSGVDAIARRRAKPS